MTDMTITTTAMEPTPNTTPPAADAQRASGANLRPAKCMAAPTAATTPAIVITGVSSPTTFMNGSGSGDYVAVRLGRLTTMNTGFVGHRLSPEQCGCKNNAAEGDETKTIQFCEGVCALDSG